MAVVSGWLVRHLKAQYIILGTMPTHQIYWAQAFVATFIMGCGPDFVLTAGQVIVSNSVQRQEQGVGGSLIGVIQVFGISTGLGFAGTVERYVNDDGRSLVKGYRGAIFLAVGFTVLAMVINLLWVRMPVQRKGGWEEEDSLEDLERAEKIVESGIIEA